MEGGGEVSEGNACNKSQTFYRTPPNMPRCLGAQTVTWEPTNFLLTSAQHGLDRVR